MALNFPNNPTSGDTHTENGTAWEYDGTSWVRIVSAGNQGFQGAEGSQGAQGAQGATGAQGAQGADSTVAGPQGAQGAQGATGAQGAQGADSTVAGPQGAQGADGAQGAQGATGAQGAQGATGSQGAQGNDGAQGAQGNDGNFGGATFDYTFSTNTTDSDPGTGTLKFSETPFSGALNLYIDDEDDNGTDIQSFLTTIDDSTSTIKGHYRISNRLDASDFALFTISAVTENTGYFDVSSSYVSGSATSFSDGEDVIITFARTGDKGDTGAQGAQGAQGNDGAQGAQGATGSQGAQGAGNTGAQGAQGAQGGGGSTGSQGAQGAQGAQGGGGSTGSQGAQGASGNSLVQAWVAFDSRSTGSANNVTRYGSSGVSSVDRLAEGQFRINFSSSLGTSNYAVTGTVYGDNNGNNATRVIAPYSLGSTQLLLYINGSTTLTVTSFRCYIAIVF